MRMDSRMYLGLSAVALLPFLSGLVHAQADLVVGEIEVDPPTYLCLGVSLPILSGDANYNAQVLVAYRQSSQDNWKDGLPLLRVRPETVYRGDDPHKNDSPLLVVPEQFAGSILHLEPDTSYEVKLTIQDPDGVNVPEIRTTLRTRRLPLDQPANSRAVNVASLTTWQEALNNAQPGDVITVANGVYSGTLLVTKSGTPSNPIFIRGQSRDGVVLNAAGAEHGFVVHTGKDGPPVKNVTIENFTITSSKWGIRILGSQDVVVRKMLITDVEQGINATSFVEEGRRSYENRGLTISDNILRGKVVWPETSQSVFNFEGVVLEGSGHVVSYNTLSGFGDSLGFEICYGGITPNYCPLYPPPNREVVRNRAVDFYGNDILWGGDDGIEMDFAERNVRAFRNRIANTGMGISFQAVWGGPVYAFRNIIYNPAKRTYKLNNEPTGFYILHNTSVANGRAWTQPSPTQVLNNMRFYNNLLVGTEGALSLRTWLVLDYSTNNVVDIDYNGWFPNGTFNFLHDNFGPAPAYDQFGNSLYATTDVLRSYTPLEHHGVAVGAPIFESANYVLGPISAPPITAPDDITISTRSGAVDAGRILSNINDGFRGQAPDLGAVERGDPTLTYGVRYHP
jgi:hypothetical protein